MPARVQGKFLQTGGKDGGKRKERPGPSDEVYSPVILEGCQHGTASAIQKLSLHTSTPGQVACIGAYVHEHICAHPSSKFAAALRNAAGHHDLERGRED